MLPRISVTVIWSLSSRWVRYAPSTFLSKSTLFWISSIFWFTSFSAERQQIYLRVDSLSHLMETKTLWKGARLRSWSGFGSARPFRWSHKIWWTLKWFDNGAGIMIMESELWECWTVNLSQVMFEKSSDCVLLWNHWLSDSSCFYNLWIYFSLSGNFCNSTIHS